jgi:hypothetical protein
LPEIQENSGKDSCPGVDEDEFEDYVLKVHLYIG